MLKKDTLGTASAKSLGEAFHCGECLHHSRSCHPHREQVCSKLGVRSCAIAPKCFTPDVTKVITNAEQFVVLASIFNSYTPSQRRIMIGILRGASKCSGKKKQFKFGTRLYLRTGGDNIESYRCGYVVGYSSSGELILTGSSDRRSAGTTFFAYLKTTEGLLTHKEWLAKRKDLLAHSKFTDSKTLKGASPNADKYLNYEVPTIDTCPEHFASNDPDRRGAGSRRKSRRTTELTEFIVS